MMQSGGFTILSSLLEGSLTDLFLQRLAKKELLNPKEGLQNLGVDAGLDAIGVEIKKTFINYRFNKKREQTIK